MKNVLVTGGCGFIGSNFIKYLLKRDPKCSIVNLDLLTYAGNIENLSDIKKDRRYRFIKGDICDKKLVRRILKDNNIDTIVNFAAETHVDRSIGGPDIFIRTNVYGTQALLEESKEFWAKKKDGFKGKRYIQVSTDEVYGSLGKKGKFRETTSINPSSPYSASKAAADLIVRSYFVTYSYPSIVTRCSNNYGPYQFPEKFMPLMIINALTNKELPIYGDGLYTRDWLYVEDHCEAICSVIRKGKNGEVYNIGGCNEQLNIAIAKMILKAVGRPLSLLKYVKDRPGHDRRYAIDASKIIDQLGWKPRHRFKAGMESSIEWYKNNVKWWSRILQGNFKEYYKLMYKNR